MKKTLLGTTALVSAGMVAGPALASDPLSVTVSGSVVTGFYVVDNDTAGGTDFDSTKVPIVARNIDINAEGTLDSGLVAGVLAKLQLDNDEAATGTSNATFSEVYGYLEGGFGRLEIGGTDGAAFKMHYTSPWFVPGNGVDSPNILNITNGVSSFSSGTSTFSLMTEDTNKVSYFTPRIANFQLGLSFTPDATVNDPIANGFGVSPEDTTIESVFEVAANYAGEFNGVEFGVDGFYVTGDAPTGVASDPEEYGFGINIGFNGFTLGGAWYENENVRNATQATPVAGDDTQTWTIGGSYGTGPWIVGVAYLESEGDSLTAGRNGSENSFLQFGGGYSLGSGVDVGLDIQILSDQASSTAPEIDSTSGGLVLAIAF